LNGSRYGCSTRNLRTLYDLLLVQKPSDLAEYKTPNYGVQRQFGTVEIPNWNVFTASIHHGVKPPMVENRNKKTLLKAGYGLFSPV
jgi:hypothetical protein